jgi:hypothetical protein
VILKVLNNLTKSYNNIFLNPFSSYFETAPFFVKPIGSINDFFTFPYLRFTKQDTMQSFADFFTGKEYSDPDGAIIQLHEHQEPSVFLDRQRFVILNHKNILEKKERLNKKIRFDFVNAEYRDTIFESKGVDKDGKTLVNIRDYQSLKNVVSKSIVLQQTLPDIFFEQAPIFQYMFNQEEANKISLLEAYERAMKGTKSSAKSASKLRVRRILGSAMSKVGLSLDQSENTDSVSLFKPEENTLVKKIVLIQLMVPGLISGDVFRVHF